MHHVERDIKYFENVGVVNDATFDERIGNENPFQLLSYGTATLDAASAPVFVVSTQNAF